MKKLILAMFSFISSSCSNERVGELIEKIDSSNIENIDLSIKAIETYVKKGITGAEALQVICYVPRCNKKRKMSFQSTEVDLLRLLRDVRNEEIIEPLLSISKDLSPEGIQELIFILSKFDSKNAVDGVIGLAKQNYGNCLPKSVVFSEWKNGAFKTSALFPRIFDLLNVDIFQYETLSTILSYLERGKLSNAELSVIENILKSIFSEAFKSVNELGTIERGKNWQYNEKYTVVREFVSMLLDVFSYSSSRDLNNCINIADRFGDPKFKYYKIKSCVINNMVLDDNTINSVAKDLEMRKWLFIFLKSHNKINLFPSAYINQVSLAESDMVNWLIFPTELGVAPDEVKIEKIVRINTKGEMGEIEYFIFKFKNDPPHLSSSNGWTAGVSGPFRVMEYPTVSSLGETFSSFEKWDSKSPEEHLGDVKEIIDRWKSAKP